MTFDRRRFYREVGRRMRDYRTREQMTQRELAEILEMPRATYANIERGRQRAPADVVWRLAVLLDLSVAQLLPEPIEDLGPDRGSLLGSASDTVILPSD